MMINEFIVNFCAKSYLPDGSIMPDFGEDKYGFNGSLLSHDSIPPIGSLCRLFAAPHTKYYLSWFVKEEDGYFYMQSIEDHSIAKWSNVGIQYIPLELTSQSLQFKYSDRQFRFQDRWHKIVKNQSYWMVPMWSNFNNETGEVTLFIRWKFDEEKIERKFPSWENLSYEDMKSFVEEVESQRKNKE